MHPWQQLVLLNMDTHVQDGRTWRCACGWQPDFKAEQWPGRQHQVHLAEEIVKSIVWHR